MLNNSQTDFEGCYIANELFKMLLFSNFDKCIETSKRIAENSSFLSYKIHFNIDKTVIIYYNKIIKERIYARNRKENGLQDKYKAFCGIAHGVWLMPCGVSAIMDL